MSLLLLQKVQDYLRRFESIPDMLELDHLTVSGDVTFGKNVSLKVSVHRVLLLLPTPQSLPWGTTQPCRLSKELRGPGMAEALLNECEVLPLELLHCRVLRRAEVGL